MKSHFSVRNNPHGQFVDVHGVSPDLCWHRWNLCVFVDFARPYHYIIYIYILYYYIYYSSILYITHVHFCFCPIPPPPPPPPYRAPPLFVSAPLLSAAPRRCCLAEPLGSDAAVPARVAASWHSDSWKMGGQWKWANEINIIMIMKLFIINNWDFP